MLMVARNTTIAYCRILKIMATPKSKTKPSKKRLWLTVAGLVILAALTYFAVDQYRDHQDREKFKRLEVAAENISGELVNSLGIELSESRKYCHYADQKWQQGSYMCVVTYLYSYGDSGSVDVRNKLADGGLVAINQVIRQSNNEIVFSVSTKNDLCSITFFEANFELTCAGPARNVHYALSSR